MECGACKDLELKVYLQIPSIFTRPVEGEDLYVYLVENDKAISLILIRSETGI